MGEQAGQGLGGVGALTRLVSKAEAIRYQRLTVAELRPLLVDLLSTTEQQPPSAGHFAWGVAEAGEPAGLLLTRLEPTAAGLRLLVLSLAVRKPWRRRGLATQLLAAAVAWARQHGLASLAVDLPMRQPSTPALEALTSPARGWIDAPGLLLVTIAEPVRMDPLRRRIEALAQRQQQRWGLQVEPLGPKQLTQLQQRAADPALPAWARQPLTGAGAEEPLDLDHCQVLRAGDQVVGWLLCHRPSPALLRYSSAWVDPPWDQRGGMFVLLDAVISEAHFGAGPAGGEQGFPIARGCFGFDLDNHAMARLSLRQFAPVASHWVETRRRALLVSSGTPRCTSQ